MKNDLQKSSANGIFFENLITIDIIREICIKITGQPNFTYEFLPKEYTDEIIPKGYNKGRLAILKYNDSVSYISFSEKEIKGRNSSIQSVPTAFNIFYKSSIKNKSLYYYFINKEGNPETEYHTLMYRLMKTIGFIFLNDDVLKQRINPFVSIDDLINSRNINSQKNKSNRSSFLDKSSSNNIELYGKVYGASKYETSMICYSLSVLAHKYQKITLYQMLEGDRTELPESSLDVIECMGNVKVIKTDREIERKQFKLDKEKNLRSPLYTYNLLKTYGNKKCAFCNCDIPEIIQGAHIYPIANIRKNKTLSDDERFDMAIDSENGLWLCQNHHRLFDQNIIKLNTSGELIISSEISISNLKYIEEITKLKSLDKYYLSSRFVKYIELRNSVY